VELHRRIINASRECGRARTGVLMWGVGSKYSAQATWMWWSPRTTASCHSGTSNGAVGAARKGAFSNCSNTWRGTPRIVPGIASACDDTEPVLGATASKSEQQERLAWNKALAYVYVRRLLLDARLVLRTPRACEDTNRLRVDA